MNLENKNTEKSFWNIIENAAAFYYQFKRGYMDEAITLGRVANEISCQLWIGRFQVQKPLMHLAWIEDPTFILAPSPVTFEISCEWGLLIISAPKLVVGRSNNWLKKSIIKIYYRLIFKTYICSFNENGK